MILVQKGQKRSYVPKSFFHQILASQGWKEVHGNYHDLGMESPSEDDSDVDYDEEEDDEEERPLSQMSFEELKFMAENMGIDIEGIRSKKELRNAIVAAREEE